MSANTAIVSSALAMLVVGLLLIWNGSPVGAIARAFPRSRRAAWVTVGVSALWTLYHVSRLGEADFGNYRVMIGAVLAALAILSVWYAPDFLAVRGASALTLLVAGSLLSATFMNYEVPALMLNAFVYLGIILALYLAVSPFRLRDFVQWLFGRAHRARAVGAAIGVCGLALLSAALGSS